MGYVEDLRKVVGHRPLIFVGAVVIVEDIYGEILLQERKQPYGFWGIPGGLMELGESIEDTARRELFEETNLRAGELNLINIYSGPGHFIKAANGDEFYVVTVAYFTNNVEGELIMDGEEALSFKYFDLNELPKNVVRSHGNIINDYKLLKE